MKTKFLNIFLFTKVSFSAIYSSLCGDWTQYKDEKCVKILDKEKLVFFEEAEKSCLQADNGSSILTIHSKEEQEFISEFLFNTNKIVENVWIGLKSTDNQFKWTDGSKMSFNNWAKGYPSNKTDYNCVQMRPDSSPIGQWNDQLCNKKNLVVCQKAQTISLTALHKILLETRKELKNNQEILKTYSSNLLSNKWFNYRLFTDTDGKHRAFFMPLNIKNNFDSYSWITAEKLCEKYSATLVEIHTEEKKIIFESYLDQLGFETSSPVWFWLNAQRDSSGIWKWMGSGTDLAFTNWATDHPKSDKSFNYLIMKLSKNEDSGKWSNTAMANSAYAVCEFEISV